MNPQQISHAHRWHREGYTQAKIAERLGITVGEIRLVLRGTQLYEARNEHQDREGRRIGLRMLTRAQSRREVQVIVANFGDLLTDQEREEAYSRYTPTPTERK